MTTMKRRIKAAAAACACLAALAGGACTFLESGFQDGGQDGAANCCSAPNGPRLAEAATQALTRGYDEPILVKFEISGATS